MIAKKKETEPPPPNRHFHSDFSLFCVHIYSLYTVAYRNKDIYVQNQGGFTVLTFITAGTQSVGQISFIFMDQYHKFASSSALYSKQHPLSIELQFR